MIRRGSPESAAAQGASSNGAGGGPSFGQAPDEVPAELDRTKIPAHVACVMDGNGRWAAQRGLPRTEGHIAGEEALFNVVNGALEIGVRWLTVYAFSTENWRRPPDEVRFLMNFNETLLSRRRDELHRRGVRIRFAGRPDRRVVAQLLRQEEIPPSGHHADRRQPGQVRAGQADDLEPGLGVAPLAADGLASSRR